ncbi:putative glycerophosphodiester phosphodiesterase, protein kinase RLK-Pelle-LRK10L-2 family [Rosa chinensis]|uniref:Putative glycerophosphodiester phosphodiesterase, protein kinase RLK-Pelle-LRK10L-2 family n=1 Tax=Rosa chinensis TaxID=74649 RepID=A0A2P6QEI7_ROSCH|nr:putative glycerophosphodiester phosphodiesterase, protein kinase RLK-Pelle-LRK10L-2 family [Rosa chinensis]
MLPTMSFLFWLLLIFVDVDVVHGGGVGLEDCTETRCSSDGPAIQFPFRLKGRQPAHCGYWGFDLSCTKDNQTLLEMPSSFKLFVTEIDYTSQQIGAALTLDCLDRDIFYHGSSSAFRYAGNTSLFSCPPSTVRDQYITDNFRCLARLSPCHGNPGNHIYAYALGRGCSIDKTPLVSCTKVHDYKDALACTDDFSGMALHWSIPSCQHCEEKGKLCRLKNGFINQTDPQTQCWHQLDVPKAKVSIILIVTGTKIYYVYSSVKREEENQLRIKRFLDDYRALKPSRYSYADIKRITEQFKEKLGQGAYGTVFKGRLSSELLVAVKILNNSNEKGEDFINEVGTMGQIHHVNVVRLVGYCADGFIRALVYEFLPNGPLQNFLSPADNESSFLGWDKLQDIALGIAKGIEYLHHGCEQQILHFDIKPHNVLLDHDFTPKVSDFGLAKLCSKDQSAVSMTAARGTMGYIAPEVFSRNFGNVSYKVDVYSFGTLLLEMVGGRKNFKVMEDSTSQVYFPEWIYNLLEQGNDLRIYIGDEGNVEIAKKLAVVGLWCIQWYPIDRPSMKTVVQMLEREGDNLTMPPNPFASTSSSS